MEWVDRIGGRGEGGESGAACLTVVAMGLAKGGRGAGIDRSSAANQPVVSGHANASPPPHPLVHSDAFTRFLPPTVVTSSRTASRKTVEAGR